MSNENRLDRLLAGLIELAASRGNLKKVEEYLEALHNFTDALERIAKEEDER